MTPSGHVSFVCADVWTPVASQVTATQRDKLMFASMFVRTNDRFLAPLQPGIPFFIGMRPKYAVPCPPQSDGLHLW